MVVSGLGLCAPDFCSRVCKPKSDNTASFCFPAAFAKLQLTQTLILHAEHVVASVMHAAVLTEQDVFQLQVSMYHLQQQLQSEEHARVAV